jgi:hypothetical protein
MSQEKNIQMDEALRKYRTLRMKVLSYNENCYPNAHFRNEFGLWQHQQR